MPRKQKPAGALKKRDANGSAVPKLVIDRTARNEVGETFLQVVRIVETDVRKADFSDRNTFAYYLSMISGLVGQSLLQYIVGLENDHLDILTEDSPSNRSKFSKWLNGVQAPFSLEDRQAVMASALRCLLESAYHGYAPQLAAGVDKTRCRIDVAPVHRLGLGEFDDSIVTFTTQSA